MAEIKKRSAVIAGVSTTARWLGRSVLFVLVAAFTACANLQSYPEPLGVSISNLSVVEAGLFEQRYRLGLRVQNPNSADLPINGVAFEVEINDQPFAKGVSSQAITIPRFGEQVMELEAVSTLAGIVRQIAELEKNQQGGSLRYRVKGKLSVPGQAAPLPFDYRGELKFPEGRSDRPM